MRIRNHCRAAKHTIWRERFGFGQTGQGEGVVGDGVRLGGEYLVDAIAWMSFIA
jgi:hypothetical protein